MGGPRSVLTPPPPNNDGLLSAPRCSNEAIRQQRPKSECGVGVLGMVYPCRSASSEENLVPVPQLRSRSRQNGDVRAMADCCKPFYELLQLSLAQAG